MEQEITSLEAADWNRTLQKLANPHILQTWEWGAVKSQFGWSSERLIWHNKNNVVAAAMVLKRSLEIPFLKEFFNVLYIPKGPVLDWYNTSLCKEVLADISDYANKNRAIFIKIDPDIVLGSGLPESSDDQQDPQGGIIKSILEENDWRFSREQVQFQNTVLLDLTPSEDELLANMKQKTRYNIRLASRKGVTVRNGSAEDIELLYQMYAETALRDGFTIRSQAYYQSVWSTFFQDNKEDIKKQSQTKNSIPQAEPLIAEFNQEPVAALILFWFGSKAWYLYGMSRAVHREKMPNYLLQWEAILRAKSAGCQVYDLWGAPDRFNETDPLWGVYRFKEGLGGNVVRHIGAWDLPLKPIFYDLYSRVLPRILELMRFRGSKSTAQSLLD